MPKRVVGLSDTTVRTAKKKDKQYKLTDGKGLYLLVTPTGGKLWRCDYSFNSKRNTLSFGSYPEVSLSGARKRRDDAKALLANGVDPSEDRKQQEQAKALAALNTFEAVTRKWFEDHKANWRDNHAIRLMRR